MAKINRFDGNVRPIAADSLTGERFVFGTTSTVSNELTAQYNAAMLRGWGSVGASDFPPLEWFNAQAFTATQFISYLHQMGLAEWNATQQYQIGSVVPYAGIIYTCRTVDHVSATNPSLDPTNWDAPSTGENVLHGNFFVNQDQVSGTVTLAAGEYGHDGFRGGASGATYTFAKSENVTTATISAGTLEQEVHGSDLLTQPYVLSFSGGCQGRIDGGTYGNSGDVKATLTGGTNAIVEFNAGTLALPQLQPGNVATVFDMRSKTVERCQRFYHRIDNSDAPGDSSTIAVGAYNTNTQVMLDVQHPVKMISVPSLVVSASNAMEVQVVSSILATSGITLFAGGGTLISKLLLTTAADTAGRAARCRLSSSTTAYIAFNSRL